MLEFLDKSKRYLWAFVEIGFLAVLAIMLVYLLLGEAAGPYVVSVVDNVMKFAAAMPTPSLVGLGILIALVYIFVQRIK
jgi:hypothetical protein